MNRKFLCTLSLFVGCLSVFAGGWFVKMPDYLEAYIFKRPAEIRLPLWILEYVCFPICLIFVAGAALRGIWIGCAAICEKLRGAERG